MITGCASQPPGQRPAQPVPRTLLFQEDFKSTENWIVECERPARIATLNAVLDLDAPAGCTLWFKFLLEGPLEIEFDATAVSAGGVNDQVSDLNVFWMARNRDGTAPFSTPRSGKFAEYNDLLSYYVGLGGNRNTTSRFRRYIGDPVERPLLPEHDLSTPDVLLVQNRKQTLVLVANKNTIEYRRDGRTLFHLQDEQPYGSGWFALRTTQSHLLIQRLRIFALRQGIS